MHSSVQVVAWSDSYSVPPGHSQDNHQTTTPFPFLKLQGTLLMLPEKSLKEVLVRVLSVFALSPLIYSTTWKSARLGD